MGWERTPRIPFLGGATKFHNSRVIPKMRWDAREVIKNLGTNIPRATKVGIAVAFERASQKVLLIADKYVPSDSGNLRESGKVLNQSELGSGRFLTSMVSTSGISSGSYTVAIQYGDASTPYAMYVHEDPKAKHGSAFTSATGEYRRPQEQYNWMGTAFEESEKTVKDTLTQHISLSIRRVLKNPRRYGEVGGSEAMSNIRSLSGSWRTQMGW